MGLLPPLTIVETKTDKITAENMNRLAMESEFKKILLKIHKSSSDGNSGIIINESLVYKEFIYSEIKSRGFEIRDAFREPWKTVISW